MKQTGVGVQGVGCPASGQGQAEKTGEQGHTQAYRMGGSEPAAAHFYNVSAPQRAKALCIRALPLKNAAEPRM